MDVNRVTLIGTLPQAPEIESSASTPTRASFALTTIRWEGRLKEVRDVHTVLASGKLAEVIAEYVGEGTKVWVEGRLRDGAVVAEQLILLGHGRTEDARAESVAHGA